MQYIQMLVFVGVLSSFITYLATLVVERFERKIGLLGEDAHKEPGRFLPKSGGLGFLVGFTASVTLFIILSRPADQVALKALVVALTVAWLSGMVGFYDDMKRLGGKTKVILTAIPGLIIYFSGLYEPQIYVPFVGNLKFYILYPILLPVIYAVASNAVNMADTYTGVAPGITLLISLFSLVASLIFPSYSPPALHDSSILLLVLLIFTMIGYLPRNFYPGKTFNGDTGSLSWGALIATVAVYGKLEYFIVLAAMPLVTNGFTILSSIKGIIEHHELKERPVIANREKNSVKANPNENAPVTLVHLLTMKEELTELEVVISLYLLIVISAVFSLIFYGLSFS